MFCVATLLLLERRWQHAVSSALWVPVLWLLVTGSRPISLWLSPSVLQQGQRQDYLSVVEGNPIDIAFYLTMIVAGLIVLAGRRIRWGELLSSNKWVFLYFAFFAASALWSDDSLVSLKRWVKDFGNLVMVMVVLSDRNPTAAVQSLFVRVSCVLLPFSVLLVKYFPSLARFYKPWTGEVLVTGVNTDKNMFGMVLTTLGISLIWILMRVSEEPSRGPRRLQQSILIGLIAITVWLMAGAESATATLCTILGTAVLIALRARVVKEHVRGWGVATIVLGALLMVSGAQDAIQREVTGLLGRDPTLHGRTEIWSAVLAEGTNPLVGVGYYNFWTPERVERLSTKYWYLLTEAHNGYLEIYLTGGLIALGLLLGALWVTTIKVTRDLAESSAFGLSALRLAILTAAIVYGFTEAIFSRLTPIWFGLLLVAIWYEPASRGPLPRKSVPSRRGNLTPNRSMARLQSAASPLRRRGPGTTDSKLG